MEQVMIKQVNNGFSDDISAHEYLDLKLEKINHPRIKQIVAEVLAEKISDLGMGSEFGEGAPT